MKHVAQLALLVLSVSTLFLASGCKEGGSGVTGGLFGGGGTVLSSLTGGDTGISSVGGGFEGPGGDSAGSIIQPEPASIALFGGGLAGLAFLRNRRRKSRKPSSR